MPTVPGSDGLINSEEEAVEVAKQVGWRWALQGAPSCWCAAGWLACELGESC